MNRQALRHRHPAPELDDVRLAVWKAVGYVPRTTNQIAAALNLSPAVVREHVVELAAGGYVSLINAARAVPLVVITDAGAMARVLAPQ